MSTVQTHLFKPGLVLTGCAICGEERRFHVDRDAPEANALDTFAGPFRYDRTVAQMAATIAAALLQHRDTRDSSDALIADSAVELARAIVAEVQRTEPEVE